MRHPGRRQPPAVVDPAERVLVVPDLDGRPGGPRDRRPTHTATYATGSLPATGSARPSFTSRRRWASASETAMFRDP